MENIARDLTIAKNTGFTDIIVDVRPTTGDVLFTTDMVDQVAYLGAWVNGAYTRIDRTATFDYLRAFIDEGHKLGLKIHAGFNTMVGGNTSPLAPREWFSETMSKSSGQQISTVQVESLIS